MQLRVKLNYTPVTEEYKSEDRPFDVIWNLPGCLVINFTNRANETVERTMIPWSEIRYTEVKYQ